MAGSWTWCFFVSFLIYAGTSDAFTCETQNRTVRVRAIWTEESSSGKISQRSVISTPYPIDTDPVTWYRYGEGEDATSTDNQFDFTLSNYVSFFFLNSTLTSELTLITIIDKPLDGSGGQLKLELNTTEFEGCGAELLFLDDPDLPPDAAVRNGNIDSMQWAWGADNTDGMIYGNFPPVVGQCIDIDLYDPVNIEGFIWGGWDGVTNPLHLGTAGFIAAGNSSGAVRAYDMKACFELVNESSSSSSLLWLWILLILLLLLLLLLLWYFWPWLTRAKREEGQIVSTNEVDSAGNGTEDTVGQLPTVKTKKKWATVDTSHYIWDRSGGGARGLTVDWGAKGAVSSAPGVVAKSVEVDDLEDAPEQPQADVPVQKDTRSCCEKCSYCCQMCLDRIVYTCLFCYASCAEKRPHRDD